MADQRSKEVISLHTMLLVDNRVDLSVETWEMLFTDVTLGISIQGNSIEINNPRAKTMHCTQCFISLHCREFLVLDSSFFTELRFPSLFNKEQK